ncbi:MAG: NAD(+) diphosphatase [Actinomycetota bacterium]
MHDAGVKQGMLPGVPWQTGLVDRIGAVRSLTTMTDMWTDPQTRVVDVISGRVPVDQHGRLTTRLPVEADSHRLTVVLGLHSGLRFVAVDAEGDSASPLAGTGRGWSGLRAMMSTEPIDQELAVQAVAMIAWHRAHTHCPRCGSPTDVRAGGYERHCPFDGSRHYPRTDPAVIMTVVDGTDRLLLARQASWPATRWSTVAGFVEPGETLEVAVRREVSEEVGITVGHVTYVGSQPWPFPSSLMIGFQATAVTQEITVDGSEIVAAQWFQRDQLVAEINGGTVQLPPRLSISRYLIEQWFGGSLLDSKDATPT